MSIQIGVKARNVFQLNHFLVVDAGETQQVGLHQYRSLVDDKRSIRSIGGAELPKSAQVEDLVGRGYCSIPRLFAVKAHGLIDVQNPHGIMHHLAALCAGIMQRSDPKHAARWREILGERLVGSFDPISARGFMRAAEGVMLSVPDSALSIEMGDGAVHVTANDVGAQIFVELESSDPKRAPQLAYADNMYGCKGSGPVHLLGGMEALVVSRAAMSFKKGVQVDKTKETYADSGMPADVIEDMHLQITLEDGGAVFLQQGVAVSSLPIPKHGVLMRAMAGGVGVWEGDTLIHVLEAGNGTTLLCHPDAHMVQLKATTPEAQLLKVPFKLS